MKISKIKEQIGYTKVPDKCENCQNAKIMFDTSKHIKSISCAKFEKEFRTICSATCKIHERGEPNYEEF